MDTGNPNQVLETQSTAPTGGEPKTFTQEDVNHIVAKRVAKYADYEELKEKAAKYDVQIEANKTDLQKATERADSLQKELDALKGAEELRTMREEVAKAKGVPQHLLTGTTKEDCEKQATEILEFAKPNSYPKVRDGGEPTGPMKKATRDQFADWFNEQN